MSGIERFFIHTVSVETYQGRTPTGDSYAAAVDVVGFMDQGLAVAADSNGFGSGGGASSLQLVEKSTFFTSLDQKATLAPQSRITYQGDVSVVASVRVRDGGDGPLGRLSHLEVTLK